MNNRGVTILICTAVFIAGLILTVDAKAHEMTPTYPKFESSFVSGVMKTKMRLFNRRNDVKYYEIGVFDSEWKPVPFVTSYKLLQMDYLETVSFDLYINTKDLSNSTYICSKSKLIKSDVISTGIASRICSKIK
jgi:hypothetical protein